MRKIFMLSAAKWKYGKAWVYSASYDEALSELHRFVIPHHDELGIPGHVEVVAGHIGRIRQLGASSFNGMKHMDAAELKDIMARGWGVGCHSYSHGMVFQDPELELLKSKELLEEAIGKRVTVYTSPGSNVNLTPEIIAIAKQYGYLAGMSITDNLNFPDSEDLFFINRPPLHEKFSDLYDSAFDPYKRITQAKKQNGWIVDYLHCPLEKAIHDYKDCSAAHHKERLEAVAEEGHFDCWFANPDEVVDYRYMRKAAVIQPVAAEPGKFLVALQDLPAEVVTRELSFILKSIYTPEAIHIKVDGKVLQAHPVGNGELCFTAEIKDSSILEIAEKI